MAYKIVETTSKPVPEPDWTHVLKSQELGKGMYDQKVKPAAKSSKADGYMNSGVDKKDFGC